MEKNNRQENSKTTIAAAAAARVLQRIGWRDWLRTLVSTHTVRILLRFLAQPLPIAQQPPLRHNTPLSHLSCLKVPFFSVSQMLILKICPLWANFYFYC